ncbi:hypothetical protein ACH5RR_006416 [Cinchona calisaya]|uniref:Uncharacterized protein n=1 Tax=Cinchona calisaya TaxID=153742 RepID=A0ABD3ANY0_9GENT
MLAIKMLIEDEIIEHIRSVTTVKEAWDTLAKLFAKKNVSRLQFLENKLTSLTQAIQGWAMQPIIYELENLLADQESLAKQMASVIIKNEEEALYSGQAKDQQRSATPYSEEHSKLGGNQKRATKEGGAQEDVSIPAITSVTITEEEDILQEIVDLSKGRTGILRVSALDEKKQ